MLIITVVTVGFLRLMVADQRQASDTDLSQSAYDSALAGVEDAKRAVLSYQRACAADSSECSVRKAELVSSTCNRALQRVVAVGAEEVPIQRAGGSSGDRQLDQAYTCVTINLNPLDVVGSLPADESTIVSLRGASSFSSVRISWFSREDVSSPTGSVNLPSVTGTDLLRKSRWPETRPSVMRTQLMQVGSSFRLGDFDAETTSGQSNANTIFLYPTRSASTGEVLISGIDYRRSGTDDYPSAGQRGNTPFPSSCTATVSAGGYACTTTLALPTPVGGGARTAFLRLTPYYKATHYKIELLNGATVVPFDGVQAAVDSTGRANDLFRRVEARIDLEATNFPFPEAAVDVTGNLCKDFTVTSSAYVAGVCEP